jgi:hypothetical protein
MTAKVDIAVSAIPSYGNSISSPGEERGAQSDAPIAERVHLGDLGANAENFDLEHAAIANAASSGENAGRNGWLPSPAIKGDKRLEKDARLYHDRAKISSGSASPNSPGKRHRPGMSHSSSSPQLFSAKSQSAFPFGNDLDHPIPPPCDARKHRHHSPPRIRIGTITSPERSGSSSGGVLLSTVRDKVNRNRSSSSVSRHDTFEQSWRNRDQSASESDEEIMGDRDPSEDSRRGFSLSEVDNRSVLAA